MKGGEGDEIKKRIDSEMEKRQKYYLGFIPANQFTHMMILIAVTVMMITCCTCFKYYNMRKVQAESKIKESREYFKKSTAFTKGKAAAAKASASNSKTSNTTNSSIKKNQ